MKRLPVLVLVLATSLVLRAQGQQADPTHGTVNVILANENGVVVVTDSQLSFQHRKRGTSQKLFRLDDSTVCSIAGFYNVPGPSTGDVFPAATAIPELMALYRTKVNASASLQSKLDSMLQVFSFNMAFVAAARGRDAIGSNDESVVTMVGFENKQPVILGATLAPEVADGMLEYVVRDRSRVEVGNTLVHRVTGFDDVAEHALTTPASMLGDSDAILRYLAESQIKDHGASLTLEDMAQIGRALTRATSQRHPIEVGGPYQTAVLADGKIQSFDALSTDPRVFLGARARVSQSYFGRSDGRDEAIQFPPYVIKLIDGATYDNDYQPLDNIMIVNSHFKHSHLTYGGNPRSYFAANNTLEDCVLIVQPTVSEQSAFLVDFRRNFPSVQVIRDQR